MQKISIPTCNQISRDFQTILEQPTCMGAILRATVTAIAIATIAELVSILGDSIVSAMDGIVVVAGITLAGYFLLHSKETSFKNAIQNIWNECIDLLSEFAVAQKQSSWLNIFNG